MCGMADFWWRVQTPNHYTNLRTLYMENFNYVSDFKPQQIIAVWSQYAFWSQSVHYYIYSVSFLTLLKENRKVASSAL